MAHATLPDGFYDTIAHHLPPEQPRGPPAGGDASPTKSSSGSSGSSSPPDAAGKTSPIRWVAPVAPPTADSGAGRRPTSSQLRAACKLDLNLVVIDGVGVRAFGGGEQTGPSPVDRKKLGTKHKLMVSDTGVPLAMIPRRLYSRRAA